MAKKHKSKNKAIELESQVTAEEEAAAAAATKLPPEVIEVPEATGEDDGSEEPEALDVSKAPGSDDAEHLEEEETLAADALEGDIDTEEALAEFASYDSLEEESVGDEDDGEDGENGELIGDRAGAEGLAIAAAEGEDGDDAVLAPKQRRLNAMRLEARVEAVIFASQKPMRPQEILDLLVDPELTLEDVERTLEDLMQFYADRQGGFRLHYLKRLGFQFQTNESAGSLMERMFATRPRPISRAALETLAIIAYRQPVTRAEVEFIRGVDAGSIFKTLLERGLLKCVGRKEVVGRPMIFGTTDEFLKVFNLSSIKDLPSLESFQPNREAVQGAMARIDENDELVDVEQYIADNTRDDVVDDVEGAVGDVESPAAEGEAEGGSPAVEASATLTSTGTRLIGATAFGPADDADGEAGRGDGDGTDADSEMALPAGDRLPEGSGDLDR